MPEPASPIPQSVRRLDGPALQLGEGAGWIDGRWLLVDLLPGRLLALAADLRGPPEVLLQLDVPLGRVLPMAGGGWLGVAGEGFVRIRPDLQLEWLHRPETGTGRRMNDAGVDARGRLWGGAMRWNPVPGSGRVHRLAADGTSEVVLDGITIPNGPIFTADGRLLYLADSAQGIIWRYELDAAGDPTDREVFASYEEGSPDGMCLDAEGGLWTAVWGGSRVDRWDVNGTLSESLPVPASQPACAALGGPDGRDLLITTALTGVTNAATGDGQLYASRVAVPAAPPMVVAAPA